MDKATKTVDVLNLVNEARTILASEDGEYEAREFITRSGLYKIHDYALMGKRPVGTYPCGSKRIKDTPESLYRVLFLFRPSAISFGDMYKTTLFTLVSPDYSLVAEIDLFKYELGVYFQASREHISGTRQHAVQGGAPGIDNGIAVQSETAKAWCSFLVELVQRKWMVYGGNDFEV